MASSKDPARRADLAKQLAKLQGQYNVITAKENSIYDAYNDRERQDVVTQNQR